MTDKKLCDNWTLTLAPGNIKVFAHPGNRRTRRRGGRDGQRGIAANAAAEIASHIPAFRFAFVNKEDEAAFQYLLGQFAELSIFGKGESPIGIASSPTQPGYVEFTVQKAGVVTSALHEMEVGTVMGIRGPLGNSWPIDYLEGKRFSAGTAFYSISNSLAH